MHCDPLGLLAAWAIHLEGHPISRSYGVNLPSSLAEGIPITLGHLPLTTSVGLRYGHLGSDTKLFLPAGLNRVGSAKGRSSPSHLGYAAARIYLCSHPTCLDAHSVNALNLPRWVPPMSIEPEVVLECEPVVHRLRLSAST